MYSESKGLTKVFDVRIVSSGNQSIPEEKGHSNDVSRGEEISQEYLKSCPKKQLLRSNFDKEKKHTASSKCKITDQLVKTSSNKRYRNHESLSQPTLTHNRAGRKQHRKGENPVRLPPPTSMPPDGHPNTLICENTACKAFLTSDNTFCKRCSCCICHLFDKNKDPSLWLVCTSESGKQDSCGFSCHIECALKCQKVGVVDLGQLMQLDGSYCCASCGKLSWILGCWKKQLEIAKDARRTDILCYRISLSYRLLDGTSRFEEFHKIVGDVKAKLEIEAGPVNESRSSRGIVNRLSVAGEVQKLCTLAIEKADAWLNTISNANPHHREDSLPVACGFQFEEVTSSSLVIVLNEFFSTSSDNIKGYKLWYWKRREEFHSTEPVGVFPTAQRRILISNLQPCTEYTFRIISYTEAGDLDHYEANSFTKSVEIIHKNSDKNENSKVERSSSVNREPKFTEPVDSSSFKVQDMENNLHPAQAQEHGFFDAFCGADGEGCGRRNCVIRPQTGDEDQSPYVSGELDLNVPDLNVALTPPVEYSRDGDIGCTLGQVVEAVDGIASNGMVKNVILKSNGNSDSQTGLVRQISRVTAVDSLTELCRKRAPSTNEAAYDCDSNLINWSTLQCSSGLGDADANFESCVKIIRNLERDGHIKRDFRMKFLTWFSLRSTVQERRVVNTFIQTLMDDPSSLAGQLVDSFLDIISIKRPRNGWH